jgi:hypothetical protein
VVSGDNGTEAGSLTLTVQTANPRIVGPVVGPTLAAAASVAASGTYKRTAPTVATYALTGTYDDASNAISVAGSGYSFDGVFDGQSRLEGTFTGPSGNGTFVSGKDTGGAKAYCGTFAGDDTGTWSFVLIGTALSGSAVSTSDPTPISFEGSVSGNNITILLAGTQVVVATGTIVGNNASGTWDNGTGTGTWTGTACQ